MPMTGILSTLSVLGALGALVFSALLVVALVEARDAYSRRR